MTEPVITATMRKFGYPQTLIADYQWWSVLARPKQVTLGALVLAAKADVDALSALPPAAFQELAAITKDIETTLKAFSKYDKLNYLMLMMVDREPHYHVIPRYEGTREILNEPAPDPGWPGPPMLNKPADFSDAAIAEIIRHLKDIWPSNSASA